MRARPALLEAGPDVGLLWRSAQMLRVKHGVCRDLSLGRLHGRLSSPQDESWPDSGVPEPVIEPVGGRSAGKCLLEGVLRCPSTPGHQRKSFLQKLLKGD